MLIGLCNLSNYNYYFIAAVLTRKKKVLPYSKMIGINQKHSHLGEYIILHKLGIVYALNK